MPPGYQTSARALRLTAPTLHPGKAMALLGATALTPAPVRYVAFAEDLLYGVRHDQHLKNLIRAGETVAAIDTFPA